MDIMWNIFLWDILEKGNTTDLKEENIPNTSDHIFLGVEKKSQQHMMYFLKKLSAHLGSFLSSLFQLITNMRLYFLKCIIRTLSRARGFIFMSKRVGKTERNITGLSKNHVGF